MLSVHGIEGIGPVRRATAVAETTDGARLPAASLRGLCGGAVHLPGDPGYDMARSPWNLQIQHHPAAVAYPANPAEVADVLAGAQQAGLRVVPQGTGHGRLRAADREGSGSLTDRIRRKRARPMGRGPLRLGRPTGRGLLQRLTGVMRRSSRPDPPDTDGARTTR